MRQRLHAAAPPRRYACKRARNREERVAARLVLCLNVCAALEKQLPHVQLIILRSP
jgi:hypothetical protein